MSTTLLLTIGKAAGKNYYFSAYAPHGGAYGYVHQGARMSMVDIVELVKIVGFGAIIFVIWLVTIRFFMEVLKQQKEYFDKIMAEQSKRLDENMAVLNKFAESIEYLGGRVSDISTKIDMNQSCPIVKKELEGR
jgi:hypothetical protein